METSDKDKRKLCKGKWGKWGHFMKLTPAQVLGLVYSTVLNLGCTLGLKRILMLGSGLGVGNFLSSSKEPT